MTEIDRIKIHSAYVFSILTGLLILVACSNWTDQPNFTEYLTNVATFVSLVLGLVAIFYSFISNASLSSSLTNISKVSDEVSLSKDEIKKFLESSKDIAKDAQKNADRFNEISIKVQDNVDSLSSTLNEINSKTEELQSVVSAIPAKLDIIQNSVDKAAAIQPQTSNLPPTLVGDQDAEKRFHARFLDSCSLYGVYLIYALKLSFESGKPFNLEDFSKTVNLFDVAYYRGFLIGLYSSDIFDGEHSAEDLITVTGVSGFIKETDMKLKTVEKVNYLFNDDVEVRPIWLSHIDEIEKYFDNLESK